MNLKKIILCSWLKKDQSNARNKRYNFQPSKSYLQNHTAAKQTKSETTKPNQTKNPNKIILQLALHSKMEDFNTLVIKIEGKKSISAFL